MATEQQAISFLGNNNGYIYRQNPVGSAFIESWPNTKDGLCDARIAAVCHAPVNANIAAVGSFQITVRSGTGNVTAVTVAGVNLISSNIVHTGETATTLAVLLVTGINNFTNAGTDYTATSSGDTVTIYADASAGATPNGGTPSVTVDAGVVTIVATTISGGATAGGTTSGDNFLIDADFDSTGCSGGAAASETSIGSDAVEMNSTFIPNYLNGSIPTIVVTIVSGVATFTRRGHHSIIDLKTQGGGADDLTDISTIGMNDGDLIWVVRGDSGDTPTCKTTGNLTLSGSADFVINSETASILFRYDATAVKWVECSREVSAVVTDAVLRTAGVSIGKSGVKTYAVGAGGGTDTHVPGTDAGKVYINGNSVTLSSNYTFAFGGSPITGEPVTVIYDPISDINGNTVTIGGQVLTQSEAEGGCVMIAWYDGASWQSKIMPTTDYDFVVNEHIPTNEIASNKLVLQAGVVAAAYTLSSVTVDDQGIITAISSGTVTGGNPFGATLWVDTGGVDSTAVKGDINLPWKSIVTALTAATSGDTIILGSGTHTLYRNLFKNGVDLYFMQGAKVVYGGSAGAVLKDDGATALDVTISGYPWIEHAGTGSNKYALELSGTGAHTITFKNAEFTGGVVEELFLINNSNAEVRFVNCVFRQQSDTTIGTFTAFSKISIENCWFVQENAGGSSDGVVLGADSIVLDGARFSIASASRFALVAATPRTIKIYSNTLSNVDVSGTITNLISGTDFIFDSDVEFYS